MDTPLHPLQGTVPGPLSAAEWGRQLWLWVSITTPREQRRFLEAHLHLLSPASDGLLNEYLAQGTGEPAEEQRLREAMRILQDARTRGGTETAVREAYVNAYGGFALDLPTWLEALGQRLAELKSVRPFYQTTARRRELLQEALSRTQDHPNLTPEAFATLHAELALVLQL